MAVKLLTAALVGALVGALVAGAGVWSWKQDQVEAAQARLRRQSARVVQAVRTTDRLHQEAEQFEARVETLQGRLQKATVAPGIAREPDGRYFGYIGSIALDHSPPTLTIDFADFLTGPEAEEAALAAGDEVLDYYVRNVNPKLRTLEISPDVRVTLETWDRHNIPDPKRVDIDLLARIFERPKPWEGNVVANGYWLTIEDGAIATLREQYVP